MKDLLEFDIHLNKDFMRDLYHVQDLVRFSYETTKFSHIIYKNKEYYPRTNKWYRGPTPRPESKHDRDEECDGYYECQTNPSIYPKKSSEPEYVIEYDYNKLDDEPEEPYKIPKLIKKIGKCKIHNISISGYDAIIIKNIAGVNGDHRGSDHCKVYLRYHSSVELKCPVKMTDFIESLYKIKSHKFDEWYEMYLRSNITIKKNKLIISIDFDHGS